MSNKYIIIDELMRRSIFNLEKEEEKLRRKSTWELEDELERIEKEEQADRAK